jgi:hypothetical protein
LKTLAEHIASQLKEREFCVVFDRDLERCWPSRRIARPEREREIDGKRFVVHADEKLTAFLELESSRAP